MPRRVPAPSSGEVGCGGARRGRGPIKLVKIVWSRELCSRGACRRGALEQVPVDRSARVRRSLWRRYGRIGRPGGTRGPGGAELGVLPDRLQAKEREISVGVDAAGATVCMASSHAVALLPYLGSSETGSRKETGGPSWSRVGSCLSGRTFQNAE